MGLLGQLGVDPEVAATTARPAANPQMQPLPQRVTYDEAEDRMVVHTFEDVVPLIKQNKALYGLNDGYSPDRSWRRVASIPLILVHKWYQQGINIADPAAWPKIASALDSKEFEFLRTAPGRIAAKPKKEYFTAEGSRGDKTNLELNNAVRHL